MPLATLTNKGQITIPKAVRKTLGLQPGDKLEFTVNRQGEIACRAVTRKVDDVFGKLHKPGRKPVSVKAMDETIKRRLKERER